MFRNSDLKGSFAANWNGEVRFNLMRNPGQICSEEVFNCRF